MSAPPVTEAIRRAAAAHDEDVERARLAWRRDAPAFFRNLLDATLLETDHADPNAHAGSTG
jgi:hypothetical protein